MCLGGQLLQISEVTPAVSSILTPHVFEEYTPSVSLIKSFNNVNLTELKHHKLDSQFAWANFRNRQVPGKEKKANIK